MCQVENLPENKIVLFKIKSTEKIPRASQNMIPQKTNFPKRKLF